MGWIACLDWLVWFGLAWFGLVWLVSLVTLVGLVGLVCLIKLYLVCLIYEKIIYPLYLLVIRV